MNKTAPASSALLVRTTRQRRLILEEFQTPGKHRTADEVYARVRKKLPNISLGTVYRNLDLLSRAGLIKRLHLGGRQKQYDGGMHRHYHVQCIRCGRISDVSADPFGDLDAAAAASGFTILSHEFTIREDFLDLKLS